MIYKVFVKVFFEKWKYMIMYSLSIITFWFVLFGNVASTASDAHYEKLMPDIEIRGKGAGDSYKLYEALDTSAEKELAEKGERVYGMTVRNLYTFSDAYYHVSYRIYGTEGRFFTEIKDYLKLGKLPEDGKAQAVIGSNVAKLLNVGVGDVLDVPITLEADGEKSKQEYIVSGILKTEAEFFSDGIYISKDTYKELECAVEYNTLYIYAKSRQSCENIISYIENSDKTGGIGEIVSHYAEKVSLSDAIRKALIKTMQLSAVVLTAVFVSLMKHTGRKIGLMKAMGVSDKDIMRLLVKGFGVYNLVGMLLSYMSLIFIRLTMGISLPISVILYSIYSYGIIFAVTIIILFVLCKRTSPRLAMYPY